jgi:class 3 adenylate cyclase
MCWPKTFLAAITVLVLNINHASGIHTLTIDHNSKRIELSQNIQLFFDSTKNIKAQDIAELPDSAFISSKEYPNLVTNVEGTWWGRIRVINSSANRLQFYMNFCENSSAISTYFKKEGKLSHARISGIFLTSVAHEDKDVRTKPFLELEGFDSTEIIYKVHTYHSSSESHPYEFILTKESVFAESNTAEIIFLGFLLGILLIMWIFTLTLYTMLKGRSFFYFSLVVFTLLLYFIVLHQIPHQLFNLPYLFSWAATTTLGLAIVISFTLLFSHVLNLRKDFRIFFNILWGISFITLLFIIRGLLNPYNPPIAEQMNYCILSWIVVAFTTISYAAIRGKKDAAMLVFSTLLLVVGASTFLLTVMHIIPRTFIGTHGFQLGSIGFTIAIMITLWNRVKRIQLEKEQSQERSIRIANENEVLVRNQNVILEKKVNQRTEELNKEKDASEKLLLNILPAEIAEELKAKGKADARDFDLVSVLFTDFKGFTAASEKLSAQDLVSEINICFEAFDGIMGKYKIEKIKTIGDAYMAAGGLPVPTDDSVKNTVLAALDLQSFISKRKTEMDALGKPAFEMRVGIHTGPVVAGIVGVKKFQYDIWGDTVNTSSRMESSGEVGKVNISQSTYNLLKDDSAFKFKSRGNIEAKGKGEAKM